MDNTLNINGLEWSAIKDDQKKVDLVVSWFSQYYAEDAKVIEYPLTESGLNYIKAVVSGSIQEEDATESNDTINNEHDVTEDEYYAQLAATEEEYVAEKEDIMRKENMVQETINNETDSNNIKKEEKNMNGNGMKRNVQAAVSAAKAKLEHSKLMAYIKTMVKDDEEAKDKFARWAKAHGNNVDEISDFLNENPWEIFNFLMERASELTSYYKKYESILEDDEKNVWNAVKGIIAIIKDTMANEEGVIDKTFGIAKDIAKYISFIFVQTLCVICRVVKVAWKYIKGAAFYIGKYVLKFANGVFELLKKVVKWVKDKFTKENYYTIDDLDDHDYDGDYYEEW